MLPLSIVISLSVCRYVELIFVTYFRCPSHRVCSEITSRWEWTLHWLLCLPHRRVDCCLRTEAVERQRAEVTDAMSVTIVRYRWQLSSVALILQASNNS